MFTINTEDTLSSGKVPAGNYEVIISKCEIDYTKGSGKEHINIDMIIRNDIRQPYQNSHIFIKQFPGKDGYNMKFINTMAKACAIQNGLAFENFQQLLAVFVNKPVNVKIDYEEFNGYDNVRVKAWNSTNYPTVNHAYKNGNAVQGIGVEVPVPNNLPF